MYTFVKEPFFDKDNRNVMVTELDLNLRSAYAGAAISAPLIDLKHKSMHLFPVEVQITLIVQNCALSRKLILVGIPSNTLNIGFTH